MPDLANTRRIPILAAILFVGLVVMSLALFARPHMALAQLATGILDNNNNTIAAGPMANATLNLHKAAVDFLNQNLNATLFDAIEAAEKQVINGTAIEAHLDAVQNYLVYNVTVADLTNELFYRVDVDAISGKVLTASSVGMPLFILGEKGNTENYVNVNATLGDAANAAENQIQNGAAIAGSFEVISGLRNPVYNVTVFGLDSGKFYKVYVDAATAKVLYLPEEMQIGEIHIKGIY
jgi:uncharacterized membrane protein YkoI